MGVPVKKNSLYINKSMLPKPAPEGRTDTLQCLKLPKCWQLISNTNIYCKMYIHQLKGSTETLQLAYIYPNCWLDICNTNNIYCKMYIHQLKGSTETIQLAYIYPNCWLDICNTNNICIF